MEEKNPQASLNQKSEKKKKNHKKVIQGTIVIAACLACFLSGLYVENRINRRDEKLDKLSDVLSILENKWYYASQVDNLEDVLVDQALKGMTTLEIDPNTNYMDLENAKSFTSSLSGSFVGVGIQYFEGEDGKMIVKNVFIDSPADKAGLKRQDVLKEVGGKSTEGMKTDDIVKIIQDYKDSKVNIKVDRDGEELSFDIQPAKASSTVAADIQEDYGEVLLSTFGETSGEDFTKALKRIKDAGKNKLLIDLRDNTGGYLQAAIDIGNALLPADTVIFQEKEKDGKIKKYKTDKDNEPYDFDEIVILQNEYSASASEVLIGALKDNLGDKVKTVGTQSYGKGTEQVSIPFEDGTSIKYTVAEWLTPNGTSINKKGHTPDIEVETDPIASVLTYEWPEDFVLEADTTDQNGSAINVFLEYLGYPTERKDNYFSSQSSDMIALFQKDNGLEETGKVDQKTWELLVNKIQGKYSESLLQEDPQKNKAVEILAEQN